MPARIAVIGDVVFDEIVLDDPERGAESANVGFRLGGKAFNIALALSRLAYELEFVTVVGSDTVGDKARNVFKARGVGDKHVHTSVSGTDGSVPTTHVRITEGISRDRWIEIDMHPQMERCYVEHFSTFEPDPWDVVLVTISFEDPVLPGVEAAIASVKRVNPDCLIVGHSLGVRYTPPSPEIDRVIAGVDVLTMNHHEAAYVLEEPVESVPTIELVQRLSARFDKDRVCITFGAQGWIWMDGDKSGLERLSRVEVADKVGASDVFGGAMCGALADGADVELASRIGGHAARIAVSRKGGTERFPSREELQESMLRNASSPLR